jgi:hypothetical protein
VHSLVSARKERTLHTLCVRIENRSPSIAADPFKRLILVHAENLAEARSRQLPAPAHRCCESDAGQCRIIVNALRREIDRLMRGIDRHRIDSLLVNREITAHAQNHSQSSAPTSVQRAARPPYAVSPIGACSDISSDANVLTQTQIIAARPMVTNLGTLLDALA